MLRLLINLDRATDRRAHMEKELSARGVDWIRVPACDCREFEAGFVEGVHSNSSRVKLDPGSIGAFMTHRKCWQLLVDSEETHALVMEDDLVFGQDAETFLKDANWLTEEHTKSVVHLETFGRVTVLEGQPTTVINDAHALHIMHRLHHGSAAYLIHRDTAQLALAASEDLNNAPDLFLFTPPPNNEFSSTPVLQVSPAPFVQDDILARMRGGSSTHTSMIAATRKGAHKGLLQLRLKLAHSLGKRWTLIKGRLTDRLLDKKTGVVDFR